MITFEGERSPDGSVLNPRRIQYKVLAVPDDRGLWAVFWTLASNGEKHCEHGPAVDLFGEVQEYWLRGKEITKEEWETAVRYGVVYG